MSTDQDRRIDLGGGAHLRQRAGSKKGLWSVYAYIDGQEIERSTKTADPVQAEAIGRRILAEARRRVENGQAARVATMVDVLTRYVRERLDPKAEGIDADERTRRKDMTRRIENYLIPYFAGLGRRLVDAVSDDDIAGYVAWRQNERDAYVARERATHAEAVKQARERWKMSPRLQQHHPDVEAYVPIFSLGHMTETVSPSTYNTEFSLLANVFDAAISWKLLQRRQRPVIAWTKPKGFRPKLLIEDVDFEAVMGCALTRAQEARDIFNKDWKARTGEEPPADAWVSDKTAWGRYRLANAIMLSACSGLRPSSLTRLRREDIRIKRTTISQAQLAKHIDKVGRGRGQQEEPELPFYVYIAATTRKGTQHTSDGQRGREIVPEAECYPMLVEYLRHFTAPGALLFACSGHALNQGYKDVLAAAGLDPALSFGGLRHAYITRAAIKGKSVVDVAKNTLTSVQMITKHYDRADPSKKAKELAR